MSNVYRVTGREKQRKATSKHCSELAQASFQAIEPYINIFDCGLKLPSFCGNKPFHVIPKENWALLRRHKANLPAFHEDGTKFHPWRDVQRNIFSPEHVQSMLQGEDLRYFTSGKKGLGLLDLDVDAHHQWQTDQERARDLLAALFPAYWCRSFRGENGYLKIRYEKWEEHNALIKCQDILQRWLRSQGILCDLEIKGSITTKERSGSLAKFPFLKQWNFSALESFRALRPVNPAYVQRIVDKLTIDEDKAAETEAHVQKLKAQDEERENEILEENRRLARRRPQVKEKRAVLGADAPNTPSVTRRPMDATRIRGLEDIRKLPNGLHRKWELAALLARATGKPQPAEEIERVYLEQKIYSEPLENPKRSGSIRWVADRIAETFVPEKRTTKRKEAGSFEDVHNILKLVEKQRRYENMPHCPGVAPRNYRSALAIIEHCFGKNPNDEIPGKWIGKLWDSLHEIGQVTCQWKNVGSRIWTKVKKWWKSKRIVICDFTWRRLTKANRYEKGEHFPKLKVRKFHAYTYQKEKLDNTHTPHNTLDASASRAGDKTGAVITVGLPPPRGSP